MPDENEDSFIAAKTGYELFGEPLRKYSASRSVAANSMGVLYPGIGEEGCAQFEKTNTYPGMLKDVIVTLWLCSIPDASELSVADIRAGAWTPTRATGRPAEAFDAALEWATPKGITSLNSPEFQKASPIALAILLNIEAAKFYVEDSAVKPGDGIEEGKV